MKNDGLLKGSLAGESEVCICTMQTLGESLNLRSRAMKSDQYITCGLIGS